MDLKAASNPELAKHYRVSVSTIKAWIRKYGSAVVREPEALQAALDSQRSAPEIAKGSPLAQARLQKVLAETEAIKFRLEIEKGKFVPFDVASGVIADWLELLYCELQQATHCLFPQWVGLSAPQIAAAAERWQLDMSERLNAAARKRAAEFAARESA